MTRAFGVVVTPRCDDATGQADRLGRLLDAQRELYDAALEERRGAWRWERRRVSRYDQYRTLTGLREVRPDILAWGVTGAGGRSAVSTRPLSGSIGDAKPAPPPGSPASGPRAAGT